MFKLPRELRDKIYEYAVYSNDNGRCVVTRKDGIREPPLLLTCKTIREEAIEVFYGVNNFYIVILAFHPAAWVLYGHKKQSLELQGFRFGNGDNRMSYDEKTKSRFFLGGRR